MLRSATKESKMLRPTDFHLKPDSTHCSNKVSTRRATTTTPDDKTSSQDSDTEKSDVSIAWSSCSGTSDSTENKSASERRSCINSEYRVSSTSTERPTTTIEDTPTPTNDVKAEEKKPNPKTEELKSKSKCEIDELAVDSSAEPSPKPSTTTIEDRGTNLIINYLPQNMTQEEIKSLFASIGEVESCKLIRDKSTCQNLGYGFVNYVHAKDAERAITTLNGLRLQNKTIKVSLARPSSESIKGANLYISGLPKSYTQQDMEKLFDDCGKIITSRILYDNNTGISRGVGFIRFDRRSEAEYAIRHLNGKVPPGFAEPIVVKLANSPSDAGSSSVASALSGALMGPAIHRHPNQQQQHQQSVFLAAAAAATVAAAATAALEVKSPLTSIQPQSSHSLTGMAFMHQMASSPNACTLSTYPLMPLQFAPGTENMGEFFPRSIAVPVTGTRPLLPAYPFLAGQEESFPTATPGTAAAGPPAPLIGLPMIPPVTSALLPGPQGLHFYPQSRACSQAFSHNSISAATAAATRLNRFPPNALTISHNAPTTLATINCVSSGIIPAMPAPPPTPLLPTTGAVTQQQFFRCPMALSSPYSVSTDSRETWCLFVHNLAPDTQEATLWQLFGPFGAVRSVSLAREHGPEAKCRGFGFVNMAKYEEAVHAMQHLNGYLLGNRILRVAFRHQKFIPRTPTTAQSQQK